MDTWAWVRQPAIRRENYRNRRGLSLNYQPFLCRHRNVPPSWSQAPSSEFSSSPRVRISAREWDDPLPKNGSRNAIAEDGICLGRDGRRVGCSPIQTSMWNSKRWSSTACNRQAQRSGRMRRMLPFRPLLRSAGLSRLKELLFVLLLPKVRGWELALVFGA